MSSREVHVTFINNTPTTLSLIEHSLSHGEWYATPPSIIQPNETAHWESDSHGFMRGTEGYAVYEGEDGTKIKLYWDNPFIKSDKNSITINGNDADLSCDNPYYGYLGGDNSARGNKEYVTFSLYYYITSWMERLWSNNDKYKNTPLKDLMIPGSHDSATYDMTSSSRMAPDAETIKKIIDALSGSTIAGWVKSQDFNILQQLTIGIRYFDLRIAHDSKTGDLMICHVMYSTAVENVLQQIAEFSQKYPKEIIILDFNHAYAINDNGQQLFQLLEKYLGNKMAPTSLGHNLSPQNLWNNNTPIIVNCTSDVGSYLFEISKSIFCNDISSPWPNTDNVDDLITFLKDSPSSRDRSFLSVTQCILNISAHDGAWLIEHTLTGQFPYNLIEWEGVTNDKIKDIISNWSLGDVNIIMLDTVNNAGPILNRIIEKYK